MSYCTAIAGMKPEEQQLHKTYHDQAYGFPIDSDEELFCRLILEINQAGLSWTTILKKEASFRKAYHQFNLKKVAAYGDKDRERLMNDPGVIRNRLKIEAAIHNAGVILQLQKQYGSFKNWLDEQGNIDRAAWTKLFKKTFRFTGGEIVNEFLVSTGYLPGSHDITCSVYKKVLQSKPAWTRSRKSSK